MSAEKSEAVKLYYSIHRVGEKPKWKPSKSFLRNFATLVKYHTDNAVEIATGFLNITGGVEGRATGRTECLVDKIRIGTQISPTTPAPLDYKLQTEFMSQPYTVYPAAGYPPAVSGNKSFYTLSAMFTTTEDKSITEMGLSFNIRTTGTTYALILVFRDILDPAVVFTAGVPYAVSYKLEFEA